MYESPIQIMYDEIYKKVSDKLDHTILQAVANANITVDRDELIKALQYDRNQYAKGYSDGCLDGKRYAWEWISVEERMPPLGRDVLVATCGGCIGIDALRADGKGWIDHGYITHWMPLPQPPREVERDGRNESV